MKGVDEKLVDEEFVEGVAERLAGLPDVLAVSLGGSRAAGRHRPDSDWDLAVYYRGHFDPADLRAVGWAGTVCELGAWGGGVFNGGAWLDIDGRRVDVHYRDLERVERELADASAGRFQIEPLAFHLAGIPTYLLVAELAGNRVLIGELPRPDGYPSALRRSAPPVWWDRARGGLEYAARAHAPAGRLTPCVGLLAQAVLQTAHAVAAAQGVWVTNEKTLWDRVGINGADALLAGARPEPAPLGELADRVLAMCEATVLAATDN
jgi:predicted nucleotidyltransferase